MGKRSNFERNLRDFYKTPMDAVLPLIPHIGIDTRFCEPCAGDGTLIDHLEKFGHFTYWASDIEPQRDDIIKADALTVTNPLKYGKTIITNPPWDRKILHPMIDHFTKHALDTWLLFDADWMHTKQAIPYLKKCKTIVSVGRVRWFPESKMTGKDNCCWYHFKPIEVKTDFVGRII